MCCNNISPQFSSKTSFKIFELCKFRFFSKIVFLPFIICTCLYILLNFVRLVLLKHLQLYAKQFYNFLLLFLSLCQDKHNLTCILICILVLVFKNVKIEESSCDIRDNTFCTIFIYLEHSQCFNAFCTIHSIVNETFVEIQDVLQLNILLFFKILKQISYLGYYQ